MKYGHQQRADVIYTVNAPDNARSKTFPFSLPFLSVKTLSIKSSIVHAYMARMVAILHVETFVQFGFVPSFI